MDQRAPAGFAKSRTIEARAIRHSDRRNRRVTTFTGKNEDAFCCHYQLRVGISVEEKRNRKVRLLAASEFHTF
jgi:hypothetical protein